jgi:hypothetical protein
MSESKPTYLALGDSMSIDDYTGVKGGGAVNQFHRMLGEAWTLDDRTFDGCQMEGVPTDRQGDLITLTIGGNDLLWNKEKYLAEGLDSFQGEHLALLRALRRTNLDSLIIVGDVYHPDAQLPEIEQQALLAANRLIQENCQAIDAHHVPINEAFRGHERDYLCMQIEPTLKGAEAIAGLFQAAHDESGRKGT